MPSNDGWQRKKHTFSKQNLKFHHIVTITREPQDIHQCIQGLQHSVPNSKKTTRSLLKTKKRQSTLFKSLMWFMWVHGLTVVQSEWLDCSRLEYDSNYLLVINSSSNLFMMNLSRGFIHSLGLGGDKRHPISPKKSRQDETVFQHHEGVKNDLPRK